MADFTVRYADFKGGDYGLRDPAKADADTFTGTNMLPYESGLLGVRAGLKLLPVTGAPTHPVVPGPNSMFVYLGEVIVGLSKPWSVNLAGGAYDTSWVAWPVSPNGPVHWETANNVVYSLVNGQLYKHNSRAVTPISVTTPQLLSYVTRWGYYFVGIDNTVPWRIWFSAVDDTGAHFDQWPANNYIDIGNNEPITALVPIYNTLYVGKRDGWNAVSGVLGTLASIRGVAVGMGPQDPRLTAPTTDNRIVYWPQEDSPAFFNGERVQVLTQQQVTPRSLPFTCDTVVVTPTNRRLILCNDTTAGTQMLTWAGSAWTRHLFPNKLGGFAPQTPRQGNYVPNDVMYAVIAPDQVGNPLQIVTWNHALNRPGHVNDQYAAAVDYGAPGGLVTGTLDLPAYWEPIGRQVRARSIIVQFRKWASGLAGYLNEIHVRLDAHGAYGRGQQTGDVQRWFEPCERSASSGTDDSWRINLGAQGWGNGFQLHFPKVTGVALREVIILCDVRTERV